MGQEQGGLFGTCQRALLRAERHVWFNRAEAKDRSAVTRRYSVVLKLCYLCNVLMCYGEVCILNETHTSSSNL